MKRTLGLFLLLLITGINQMHGAAAAATEAPAKSYKKAKIAADISGLDDEESKEAAEAEKTYKVRACNMSTKVQDEENGFDVGAARKDMLSHCKFFSSMLEGNEDELTIPVPESSLHGISLKEIGDILTIIHDRRDSDVKISIELRKHLNLWNMEKLSALSLAEDFLEIPHLHETLKKLFKLMAAHYYSNTYFLSSISRLPEEMQKVIPPAFLLHAHPTTREFIQNYLKANSPETRECPPTSIESGVVSPNRKLRAVRNEDKVTIWDCTSKTPLRIIPIDIVGYDSKIIWGPDSIMLIAIDTRALTIYDSRNGNVMLRIPHWCNDIVFSPDCQKIALLISTTPAFVELWDIPEQRPTHRFPAKDRLIRWLPNNIMIFQRGSDTYYKFDLTEQTETALNQRGKSPSISPDGKILAISNADKFCLIDLKSGDELCSFTMPEQKITWSPDNETIMACTESTLGETHTITIIHIPTRSIIKEIKTDITTNRLWVIPQNILFTMHGNGDQFKLWDLDLDFPLCSLWPLRNYLIATYYHDNESLVFKDEYDPSEPRRMLSIKPIRQMHAMLTSVTIEQIQLIFKLIDAATKIVLTKEENETFAALPKAWKNHLADKIG